MRSFRNPYHIDTLKHVKSHGAAFLYMHWNHLCSEVLLRFVCEILNFHQMTNEKGESHMDRVQKDPFTGHIFMLY